MHAVGNLGSQPFLPDLPVELRQASRDANAFQRQRGVEAYVQRMMQTWKERGIDVSPVMGDESDDEAKRP